MTLGLVMYFYYGITHSSLENTQEEIELAVDQSHLAPPKATSNHHQPTAVWDRHGYENRMAEESWTTTNNYALNAWDIHDTNQAWGDTTATNKTTKPKTTTTTKSTTNSKRPPPPPRPQLPPRTQQSVEQSQPSKSGFGGIFVEETQFPTWED